MASASLWLGQSIAVRHKRHIDFAIQVHPEQIARGQKKIPVKVSQQLTGRYREDPSFCLPSCLQALWVQPLLPSPLFPLSSLHDVSIYRLRFISIIHHNAADLKYIFRWKEWSREKMIKRPKKNELWRAAEFIPSVEPIGSIQGYPARRIAIQPHLFSTMQVGSSPSKSPL